VNRFVLLLVLAGVMLCCVGVLLLSLPLSAPHLSSALAGANVEDVDRAANAPAPLPGGSYPLMPAEAQETDSAPVNASLLMRILLTNARRQGAICSSWIGDDRGWLAVVHEDPSFLGVFRL
jgi:hypothetical protein